MTRELQSIWREWLATSEMLLRLLHEQTAAVTLRDIKRVERIQPELDLLMSRLRQIDERAIACANHLAADLSVEATVKAIVRKLDKAEGQELHGTANRITIVARNLQEVMAKNRSLIDSEMVYVDGRLALVAKAAVQARTPVRKRDVGRLMLSRAA